MGLIRLIFISLIIVSYGACSKSAKVTEIAAADTLPHDRIIHGVLVKGKIIDDQTRCSHYHTKVDIIALKFKCCKTYYHCYKCHLEEADHKPLTWELIERDQKAVLCGVCGGELTIAEYLASNNICPTCQSHFNPNCKKHYQLYFKTETL